MSIKYLTADALNMTLQTKDDKVWGGDIRTFKFGPWSLNLWLHVESDICNKQNCSLWVRLTNRVWFYLMVTERSTKLAVFDAEEVGITLENYEKFGGSSMKETLEQLGSAVKAMFEFTGDFWIGMPLPKGVGC